MSKKSIMAKLLTMLTFFGGIKTKAFVHFPKYLGRNMSVNQLLDENQNIDEKNIIKKCIEINKELIKLVDRFADYQNTVKKIINQIRIWFDEIQKSKRFEEISKTKEFKEKMDKYDEDEFFGEKVTRDFIYDCYTLLPEDERKEFDKKAEEFRNKLLDILKNEEKKFNGCGERFTELTSNFDSLIKSLNNKYFEEIIQAEKNAKVSLFKKDPYFDDSSKAGQERISKRIAMEKVYEALSDEEKQSISAIYKAKNNDDVRSLNINLTLKKKILSWILYSQKNFIDDLKNDKVTYVSDRFGGRISYIIHGYDFKNPTAVIEEFREFIKDINLHKQQYIEGNDLDQNLQYNIHYRILYDPYTCKFKRKILKSKIQVCILNERNEKINSYKNAINDTNKDFEFLLQNL